MSIMVLLSNGCSTTKEKVVTQDQAPSSPMTEDTGDDVVKEAKGTASLKETVTPEGRDLVLATRYGQENVVKTMLDRGVDIQKRDELGNTALIAAASEGHKELVTLLLSHRAEVNAQSNDGTSALMAAASVGNRDIAGKLLKGGAKVDIKRDNGETALFDAVNYGHIAMVKWLLPT